MRNKGVYHTMGLSFTFFKNIVRKKKNYRKIKYFTMQKYINLQKNPLNETNLILQDIIIITLL